MMRKQELIHLHALLAEVRRELAARRSAPLGAFDAYESHGVQPVAIYGRKEDHAEAIDHLLDGIETMLLDGASRDVDRLDAPVDTSAPR